MSKEKIKLNILGVSFTHTYAMCYAVILAEEGGKRKIPIIIGGIEAHSIAIKLEKLQPPRPLTHDLFINFAKLFSVDLQEVIIYKIEEGLFFSELIFKKEDKIVRIDSRTSDAVALAIRFNCPIYTYEEILAQAGIIIDDEDTKNDERNDNPDNLPFITVKELKIMLNEAIDTENYEMASMIRDEIVQREEQKV
jgi:bifunctional DNase/RNase